MQQRFSHNLTDNPFCPSCRDNIETVEHLFLICPVYEQERNILFNNMSLLDEKWLNSDIMSKLNMLIKGYKLKAVRNATAVNVEIFKFVQNYMQQTKRFVY